MTVYTPDRWVIIRITGEVGVEQVAGKQVQIDKVLAGWSGGYLDGDSWRLNSGITRIEETDRGWDVHGASGSVYKLRKGAEGMTVLMASVLSGWQDSNAAGIEVIDIADVVVTVA